MSPRQCLVLLHRYVGLAIALFLVLIGVTGSLLAFNAPLSKWIAPELYEAPGRGAVLTPAELARRVKAQEPHARIQSYPLDLVAGEGAKFAVAPEVDPATGKLFPLGYDSVWVDPRTAQVLGRTLESAGPPTRLTLMSFVYRLHCSLAIPGQWGTWILGMVALLWFFDCFVGFVLTMPRGRPFLAKWRLAWGVRTTRLNFDLHRAGGLWFWALLATIALSGVNFNLNDELFAPVFSLIATTTPEPDGKRAIRSEADTAAPRIDAATAIAIASAQASSLGWRATPDFMSRRTSQGLWQVYFKTPAEQWATAGNYGVFIDDETGAVVHVRRPGGTAGDVFLQWLSALHEGAVFGWPYKVLLCATGGITAMLSVTGLVIWLRKRRARRHMAVRRTRAQVRLS